MQPARGPSTGESPVNSGREGASQCHEADGSAAASLTEPKELTEAQALIAGLQPGGCQVYMQQMHTPPQSCTAKQA